MLNLWKDCCYIYKAMMLFIALYSLVCYFLLIVVADKPSSFSPPLHMDIEWVLQGKEISFTGFFVEFLGFSRAIRSIFPHLRLSKSFYSNSFSESPLPAPLSSGNCFDSCSSESPLLRDLFLEEKENIVWLVDTEHKKYAPEDLLLHSLPRSRFFPNSTQIIGQCKNDEEVFNSSLSSQIKFCKS